MVEGTAYRWRLRGRPTYGQGVCWSPCTYAVEQTGSRGTVLVVTTGQPHPSNWIGRPAGPVQPSHVATAIRHALGQGWTPTHCGPPFHLDQSATFEPFH
ncbi:hypothetical protein GCM10027168_70710 [Streptomyces capparidis]